MRPCWSVRLSEPAAEGALRNRAVGFVGGAMAVSSRSPGVTGIAGGRRGAAPGFARAEPSSGTDGRSTPRFPRASPSWFGSPDRSSCARTHWRASSWPRTEARHPVRARRRRLAPGQPLPFDASGGGRNGSALPRESDVGPGTRQTDSRLPRCRLQGGLTSPSVDPWPSADQQGSAFGPYACRAWTRCPRFTPMPIE